MADPTYIRVMENGGTTDVKILMKHDMKTGQHKDASGEVVPVWHITSVTVQHNGKMTLDAQFGPAVSKDPFLNLKFRGGAKGDKVTVTWIDNHGDRYTDETSIQQTPGDLNAMQLLSYDRRAGGIGCGRQGRCPEYPACKQCRCPLQGGLPIERGD